MWWWWGGGLKARPPHLEDTDMCFHMFSLHLQSINKEEHSNIDLFQCKISISHNFPCYHWLTDSLTHSFTDVSLPYPENVTSSGSCYTYLKFHRTSAYLFYFMFSEVGGGEGDEARFLVPASSAQTNLVKLQPFKCFLRSNQTFWFKGPV